MTGRVRDSYGACNTPEEIITRLREGRVRVIDFRLARYGDLFLEPSPMWGISEWNIPDMSSTRPLLILRRI